MLSGFMLLTSILLNMTRLDGGVSRRKGGGVVSSDEDGRDEGRAGF